MNTIAKSFINFTNTISTLTAAVPFKKHEQKHRPLGVIVNANLLCATSLNGSSQSKRLTVKQYEVALNATNDDTHHSTATANLASLPEELRSGEVAIAVADTELFSTVSTIPAGTYGIHDLLQIVQQQLPMQLEALYLDFFIIGPSNSDSQLKQQVQLTVAANHHLVCQALPRDTFQNIVRPAVPESYTITACCSRLHAIIVLCDALIRVSIPTQPAWCLAYPKTPNGEVLVLQKITKGTGWPIAEIELGSDWQTDSEALEHFIHVLDQQIHEVIIIPFSPNHLDYPIDDLWLSMVPERHFAASSLSSVTIRWLWYSAVSGAGLLSLSELRHELLTSSEPITYMRMRLLSLAVALVHRHRYHAERVPW